MSLDPKVVDEATRLINDAAGLLSELARSTVTDGVRDLVDRARLSVLIAGGVLQLAAQRADDTPVSRGGQHTLRTTP